MEQEKLITVEEAKKLVSSSNERKQELINVVNREIRYQSSMGLRWAHMPTSANNDEQSWLQESLIINGFHVTESHPRINW